MTAVPQRQSPTVQQLEDGSSRKASTLASVGVRWLARHHALDHTEESLGMNTGATSTSCS